MTSHERLSPRHHNEHPTMRITAASLLLAAAVAPLAAHGQVPVRPLGDVVATTSEALGIPGHLRALPGGRVIVNDVMRRRVLLLDSAMNVVRVVIDSTTGAADGYGPRPGGLVAWKGDSTLFIDPASLSMLVIDAGGKVVRVMSVPRTQEANALTSISFGTPALDADGRLVYRAFPAQQFRMAGGAGAAPSAPPSPPDSAAIVRLDLATRKVDTATFIRIPKVSISMQRTEDGQVTMSQTINPLPMVDDWAVTSTGRLAVVRGRDYRVDWIGAGGEVASTGKIPFDWRRLTDEDKVALIDSVKAQRERMSAQGPAGANGGGPVVMFGGGGGAPMVGAPGETRVQMSTTVRSGAAGAPSTTVSSSNVRANIQFVTPDELPDYQPPFFAGAVRADADGNVWIRTIPTRALAGGPVYDVVDGKGELVDRVQLPHGREIRAFGPGGVVYLMSRGTAGTVLERARVR